MTELSGAECILQTTISNCVEFQGVGLHSGASVSLKILPAPADHGIVFERIDVEGKDNTIAATWKNTEVSRLCTMLRNAHGVSVSTIEHVMAALVGCGIHNAVLQIDGPELPILDGSAQPFASKILSAGVNPLPSPLKVLRVLKEVEYRSGMAVAKLVPSSKPWMTFDIDFKEQAIGKQSKSLCLSNGSFVRELCASRTFCRFSDVEAMREQGLALGGNLKNAVVVNGSDVLSPGGLRHEDEAVRHKMLDAVGDLGLAGMPILGHYIGHRAGHAVTAGLIKTLFNTSDAFEIVPCTREMHDMLPGVHASLEEIELVA